jgi:hypothetical protein
MTKMVSIRRVLADVYTLIDQNMGVTEDVLMEWAATGLAHFYNYKVLEEAICFRRVENHQTVVPTNMVDILSVMYLLDSQTEIGDRPCPDDKPHSECISVTDTKYLNDEKTVSKKKLYELKTDPKWTAWKYLSVGNSHATLSLMNEDCPNIGAICEHTFMLTGTDVIRTTFEKGWIAIHYRRPPIDENGDFLIPDIPNVSEALLSYVLMKIFQKQKHMGVQGAKGEYNDYRREWQEFFVAGESELMMPSLPEWYNIIKLNRMFKDSPKHSIFTNNRGEESINLF